MAKMCSFIFKKEFWATKASRKCLVGRLILLNKDHPKIPEIGRFRPIRVCSNVVKALEKFLAKKLAYWSK
jgi:hypothetical protein